MRILGRMLQRQSFELAVDLLNALRCDHAVHIAESALLNGEKISVGIAQVDDVVDERHQEVQLRPAPEVVGLLRPRRVLHDRVGHRLHELRLGVQTIQAVPAVRVFHVQEVHSFHIKAVLSKIRGEPFKQLALRIRNERGLAAFGTAHEERDDKASGLAAARCADAEQIVVVPGDHPVRSVERVSIRIVRMLFDFAEDHALRLACGREF